MMRAIFILILFAVAIPAEANSFWNRLWLNPDQRGEALLQQGDASAAAGVYKNPQRKAYAEMKAGNLKQAASDLGNLHDSDSDYNRGNALAKMGDLKGALDAYDAALKSDPKNHDAQHNRNLVAKALKQQQQQNKQQSSQQNGKPQDNKPGGKKGSNPGGQGNQSGKNASGANEKNGPQSLGGNSSQSGKNGSNAAGGKSSAQQNRQQGSGEGSTQTNSTQHNGNSNSAAQSGQGQTGQDQTGAAENQQQAGKSPSPDNAAQARQDAAAGLAAQKGKQGTAGNENAYGAVSPPAPKTPLSEQQLSKEQWLRSIPDDPGGLLRRKFMIEYMLRQQKAQQ